MNASKTTLCPARLARLGGLLYLLIIVFGVVGEAAIRGPLQGDDPAQTMANLIGAESAFRWSMMGDVLMVLADVALGVILFVLLAPIDRTLSLMAMAFRLAQAAVLCLNLGHLDDALAFAHGPLDVTTRAGMVTQSLQAHAAGYDLGLFFFALNCMLVGWLLRRLGRLPRIIGCGVAVAGAVYLVGSTLRFVAPDLADAFAPAYGIPLLAELAICGWLLGGAIDSSPAGTTPSHEHAAPLL